MLPSATASRSDPGVLIAIHEYVGDVMIVVDNFVKTSSVLLLGPNTPQSQDFRVVLPMPQGNVPRVHSYCSWGHRLLQLAGGYRPLLSHRSRWLVGAALP